MEKIEDQETKIRQKELQNLKKKLFLGIGLTVLIFIFTYHKFFPLISSLDRFFVFSILLVLTVPVQFWVGLGFYQGFWRGLKNRNASMDTLIAIGTSAAFFYSVLATFFPQIFETAGFEAAVYYDTAAAIITLIILGKFFEARAKGQASEAIKKLLGLQAKTARVLRGGNEMDIKIEEVKIGDVVIVKPGEKIPVDGEIIEGSSSIDESMITGESIPIDKGVDNEVIGATINKSGTFKFKATKVGKDTALAQIVKLVAEAQGSKAPIQRVADLVSGYFVPAVLVIAVITFVAWFVLGPNPALTFAFLSFVAVLIIACPCALGLATPTAVMVGTGKGAEAGILIKDASHLERAGKITTVVFDKTGTLTRGEPEVTDVVIADNGVIDSERELLRIAASAEKYSEHPLGKAVFQEAQKQKIQTEEPKNFQTLVGFGIEAKISGKEILEGNITLMEKREIEIPKKSLEMIDKLASQGKTPMIVAQNSKFAGIIAVADQPKETAKKAIEELHRIGVEVVMITGDNQRTAEYIAKKLGIDKVLAQVKPDEKEKEIQRLKTKGKIVAMIGDGINDAPALAASDIGIAIGSGTDVAIEAAGITLIGGDPIGVARAIRLSRATMRNIRQNLFFAFFYNSALIPVAAGILYPAGILLSPIFAAFAMASSSLSVVLNSLRLKRFSFVR